MWTSCGSFAVFRKEEGKMKRVNKKKRAVSAAVILVCLLFTACSKSVNLDTPKEGGKTIDIQPTEGAGKTDYNLPSAGTTLNGLESCASDAVRLQIRSYYAGIVKKDINAIKGLVSDKEAVTEDVFKGYEDAESFNIREMYWMNGENSIGYVIYVVCDIKYRNFEQTVPSLDEFYLRERKDGIIIINGRVSADDYNASQDKISAEAKVRQISDSVNRDFNTVMEENPEIKNYLDNKKVR